MLVVQPPPSAWFRPLPVRITQHSLPGLPNMASSPRAGHGPPKAIAQPSVFNALGSYADRIKGNEKSPAAGSAELKPSSSSSSPSLVPAAGIRSPPAPARPQPAAARKTSAAELPPPVLEDDGPWETVQSGRRREKPTQQQHQAHQPDRDAEKRAGPSNSANWRERPSRRSKDDEDRGRGTNGQAGQSGTKGKKEASSSLPPLSAEKRNNGQTSSRIAASAVGTPAAQAAWDASYPSLPPSQAVPPAKTREETLSSSSAHAVQTPQAEPSRSQQHQSQTEPSSPQLATNSITASSLSTSVASPDISNDNTSQSTAPTSLALRDEDEGSWRVRPRQASADAGVAAWQGPVKGTEEVAGNTDATVEDMSEEKKEAEKKPLPPPATNAWAIPKKPTVIKTVTQSPATGPQVTPATAQPLQFGTLGLETQPPPSAQLGFVESSPPVRVGVINPATQKKKKKSSPAATATPALSSAAFPDLVQAVKMEQALEEEKSRAAAERKEAVSAVDDSSTVDDATGKKPKWTAIPASELQAAMDEAAESARRQQRAETAARKKAGKTRSGPPSNVPSPTKSGARSASNGPESGAGSVKLPPVPQGQQANDAGAQYRPVFGSIEPGLPDNGSTSTLPVVDDQSTSRGGFSEPMSRRSSKDSRSKGHSLSPRKARSSLPSPGLPANPLPENPYRAQHVRSGSSSLPSGLHPFHGQGSSSASPRRGRGGFGGRGRGGFRGPYMGKYGSPPMFGSMTPSGGGMFAGPGYGGYPYYPQQGYPVVNGHGTGFYDPMAASYSGMGVASPYSGNASAPAPLPITSVPSTMDPQRFYLLGQIEYYFSEQNLAMDLFLRQQMDSEGWIDIPIIAAFNRVRSLGPDLAAVKETMKISSLLEVSPDEEKVRLSNGLGKRYVLPDAKQSGVTGAAGADLGESASATGSVLSPASGFADLGDSSGIVNGLSLSLGSVSMGVGPSGMGLDMGMNMGMPSTSDSLGLPDGGSQRQRRTYSRGEVESMLMKNGGVGKERAATEPAKSRSAAEPDNEDEEVLVNGDEAR